VQKKKSLKSNKKSFLYKESISIISISFKT
jgi:hypothetical protein